MDILRGMIDLIQKLQNNRFFKKCKESFKLINGNAPFSGKQKGTETESLDEGAIALGKNTIANSPYELAIGRFNYPAKDQLFSVGDGYNEEDRRNVISVSSKESNVYIKGIGGYDGQNQLDARSIQKVFSHIYINYVPECKPLPKEKFAELLGVSANDIDLLLCGGVRSIRFQFNDSVYTFPFAGSIIMGDEVDTYGMYEITPSAACFTYSLYYGTFVIHKNDFGYYDCKFDINTYDYNN